VFLLLSDFCTFESLPPPFLELSFLSAKFLAYSKCGKVQAFWLTLHLIPFKRWHLRELDYDFYC
jgi:hypothetical protein